MKQLRDKKKVGKKWTIIGNKEGAAIKLFAKIGQYTNNESVNTETKCINLKLNHLMDICWLNINQLYQTICKMIQLKSKLVK